MFESGEAPADRLNGDGPPVSVVHLTAEYLPYARTGGLGEAVRGIAHYQASVGIPTTVVMPLYRAIREHRREIQPWGRPFRVTLGDKAYMARLYRGVPEPSGPDVLFVDHRSFFDHRGMYGEGGRDYEDNHLRFSFFSKAALRALPRITGGRVVLHPHDWHTALAAVYLETTFREIPDYRDVACVLSVHNAGYQGHFPLETLATVGVPEELRGPSGLEWYGRANWLKGGIRSADVVTTVSPGHAEELRHEPGGFGLHHSFRALGDRLVGILNGIDTGDWNPADDIEIIAPYSASDLSGKAECKRWLQTELGFDVNPEIPLFAMAARIVEQKGVPLIIESEVLEDAEAQFVFLGTGDPALEARIIELAARHPDRIVFEGEFTERREHLALAGADALLMPSLYEPCGLTQMRAQLYGTLPVVRRTGGLADTVADEETGFLFEEYEPGQLRDTVFRAIERFHQRDAWHDMVVCAMGRDFSWARSGRAYLEVYAQALAHRAGVPVPA